MTEGEHVMAGNIKFSSEFLDGGVLEGAAEAAGGKAEGKTKRKVSAKRGTTPASVPA
jgi:hypothetical protein